MDKEVNQLTIEEYYISLLVAYGQDERDYRKLRWQDEQELPLELTTYIYSDDFLEIINKDIREWHEELIEHIKSSTAYSLLKDKVNKEIMHAMLYEQLIMINNQIVEIYAYQRCQNKKFTALKQNALLLKEGIVFKADGEIEKSEDKSLDEVNGRLEELRASYTSLHKQLAEVENMKKKLGYRIKQSFCRMGLVEADHKEEILKEQMQVIESKVEGYAEIKAELERRYASVEEALNLVEKEILAPQVIGELTNIQQQLLLSNDAILKQIARPLLRKIQNHCDIPIPKGLYRFKLYIELSILYGFRGPLDDEKLKEIIYFDNNKYQPLTDNEYALLEKIVNKNIAP